MVAKRFIGVCEFSGEGKGWQGRGDKGEDGGWKTSNIQHPTPNFQRRRNAAVYSAFAKASSDRRGAATKNQVLRRTKMLVAWVASFTSFWRAIQRARSQTARPRKTIVNKFSRTRK